jgi:excisionase family DNA binding protein
MTRQVNHTHNDLSVGEAARYFGVHAQTVRNWCDIGRLKWSRIEDGPRRIPPAEVIEVLRRNHMEIPPRLLELARAAELAAAA